jgi:SAM-dependent methyltransferase
MLTEIQYRILKTLSSGEPPGCSGAAYEGKSKLDVLLGAELLKRISGKVVIDFGCGEGVEAVELARRGAKRVIGIDIRDDLQQKARQRAWAAGVQDICFFSSNSAERAEIIVTIDAFEHFSDPAEVLRLMNTWLHPAGEVLASFGPTWYHPLGGHLFSVFPWAHLIFSERSLIRWRSSFRTDGATRFSEVSGGLNQMTISRFEELIDRSAFKFASLEFVPIKKLRSFHNRITREFTTSIVRCCLVKRTAE